ncbi:hypothetical protein WJ972_28650 [Achromobacter insuavis]
MHAATLSVPDVRNRPRAAERRDDAARGTHAGAGDGNGGGAARYRRQPPVGGYFETLAAIKAARGEAPDLARIGERIVGVSVAAGEAGWTTASTCSRPRSRRSRRMMAGWTNWRGAPRVSCMTPAARWKRKARCC